MDEQITDYHSLTELQEVLSQTIPFTREELNYFFPLQVCDFLRFQIIGGLNERIGVSSVEADFIHKYDSSKHIYVEVLDGAGVNGSIFLLSSMERLKENFEEINSNERIRVFYHEGYRGFLKEKFQDSILEFELIYENRFRVKFHSGKMKKKELVDFIHEYPLGFLADSLVKRIE
ncbi:hypothetical protein [Algoriphagus hitonicola]|uniref:hypothetical protein n=1 Tax=Algoriphagus hitonicola TaxID=435880 RepID=UPI0011613553|nr:hypothetical protein [Algoriphagus hitonicola]